MNAKLFRPRLFVIAALALVVAWTGFIFSRSSKTGESSSVESEAVTEFIEDIVEVVAPGARVTEKFVRKLAHFCEYGLLGALCVLALGAMRHMPDRGFGRRWYCVATVYSVIIAVVDEFVVQRNSVGRGPSLSDVALDSIGAVVGVVGMLAVFGVAKWLSEQRKKSAE